MDRKEKVVCPCGKPATTVQLDRLPRDGEDEERMKGIGHAAGDLLKIPPADPERLWMPRCGSCGSNIPVYHFTLDRIETYEQALDWTIHLAEKDWFSLTIYSWGCLLSRLFPEVLDRA